MDHLKSRRQQFFFLVDVELHYDQAPLVCICIYIYIYIYIHDYIYNGGPQVWSKKCRFFGAPEPVPGDVRCCTHTAGKRFGSQRYRANTQLAATSNTARGIFRAIPCGLCHRIPVLPQWEALLCSKSRFYHNGSVPEILLLENIILSPTGVSKEPCHSGSVSASSCSWLFLVSMFPLASKWHKLPPPFLVGFPVIHLAWPEVQLCATIIAKS